VRITARGKKLSIDGSADPKLTKTVAHMFRLDEDLSGFYELVRDDPALDWCASGAGRMLRAPTVFEDVVKTICTSIRIIGWSRFRCSEAQELRLALASGLQVMLLACKAVSRQEERRNFLLRSSGRQRR